MARTSRTAEDSVSELKGCRSQRKEKSENRRGESSLRNL